MSDNKEALHGLACPRCGGMVPIPEGQAIVKCPYCDLRSLVKGERGIRHYQVPLRLDRPSALAALSRFLSGNIAIARDAPRKAQVSEAFVAYVPYWMVWGRMAAWVFGEKQVGSGDNRHYEPREKRIVEEMSWDAAACDVGEFGVNSVEMRGVQFEPYDSDKLHGSGMVFEPVGSLTDAMAAAEANFQENVRKKSDLDRVSQVFTRMLRQQMGVVYYPLWIVRYLYRGRVFQVAVDGFSGQVLYGKAPGSTFFRAAVLVGGMAVGAVLALDIPAGILSLSDHKGSGQVGFALVVLAAGFSLMYFAYRKFRYGEEYEFHRGPWKPPAGLSGLKDVMRILE